MSHQPAVARWWIHPDRVRIVPEADLVPVAQCDPAQRYLWVNEAFARLIGRSASEIVGRTVPEVLGEHGARTLEPVLAKVLAGEHVEIETEADLEGVGPRILRVIYLPTRDGSGASSGWMVTIRDVTAQRRAEEDVSRLAAIVESSDDAIVGKSLQGIVTSWNRGAERLFGYTAEEMVGQPIQRLMPADRIDDMHRILGSIRIGERVDHYETERIRKDGTRIQVSLTVSPIRDASGNVIGASKIARDVTQRRRAEKELRESLELVSSLNRASVLLSAELDLSRLVQEVSDAATQATGACFGAFFVKVERENGGSFELSALSGIPREALASLALPRDAELLAATFRGGAIVRLDDVRSDPRFGQDALSDGAPSDRPAVASYLVAPVVLRGEVVGGLLFGHPAPAFFTERDERFLIGLAAQAAIAMDNARLYTAERCARAEAEAASRAKDELLSIVSHELRTPLSAIMGWIAVLRQGKLSPERAARALETIERSGRVQGELIEDLLDVSRIVTGRLNLDVELLDVTPLVEAAVDAARPDAIAKGVVLLPSLARTVPVRGDATRLQQVVSNLIGNAVKFSVAGGRVFVVLATNGDVAEITVRDEGEGIAASFLPEVFEPFRQANDVRKRKGGGLGLGLTIVKNLVESHGGSVRVTSAGLGHGAEFVATLPLATAAAADDDPRAVRARPGHVEPPLLSRAPGSPDQPR